jgi:phosphoribosyl 1,2-cyclic phosphate phosphodiesterase
VRVTLLGTGTSTGVPVVACACAVCRSTDPRDHRLRPSALLEWDGRVVLVDTSTDLRQQCLRHEIARVDAVLYTHAHADHILGLDDLRIFNWLQRGAIPAYGAAATLAALRRTFAYAWDDTPVGGGKPALDLRPVDGPFDLLGRRVVPVPLQHGELTVLGFRIGAFAYLTDVSQIPATSYPLLRGLEVLVLNALRPRPHPTHLHLEAALREARVIGARRTIFTHMGHDMPHRTVTALLPAGVELGWDGLRLDVEAP